MMWRLYLTPPEMTIGGIIIFPIHIIIMVTPLHHLIIPTVHILGNVDDTDEEETEGKALMKAIAI